MKTTALRTAVFALALVVAGCNRHATMGDNPDCRKAVDALYTALTAREPALLDQAERELKRLADAGKLPAPAARQLEKVVAKARSGRWQPAAEDLTDFIKAQRGK